MRSIAPKIALATAVVVLTASVYAKGYRYAHEVPGFASMAVDTKAIMPDCKIPPCSIARNKRIVAETDFAPGKGKTFGGTVRAYVGDNEPFVGDFNGDGWDDIGVRWKSGPAAGHWTISLNDRAGNFNPGKGVTFGGTAKAYVGDNRLFVGDFDHDGRDDIGVHWKSGPAAGHWTISLNDRAGNFNPGKGVTFGGTAKAFVGPNEPFVGDFDGDGWDDIGVRWTGGVNTGRFTISRNDHAGTFHAGVGTTFGGVAKAYVGGNQLVVGDFNGDRRDDIGVRWTAGAHKHLWTISLNAGTGFEPGRSVDFGHVKKAYAGNVRPIVGDFNHDGYDDIGVKWLSGANAGRWVFSRNRRRQRITRTPRVVVRIPVVFVNYPRMTNETTDERAAALLDNVRRYFRRTSHGVIVLKFRYRVVKIDNTPWWHGGVPFPRYGADGKLINGEAFPSVREYAGYGCRFRLPGATGSSQIIFKDANGNLAWKNNANIHRNYCQVGERNFAKDALTQWRADDREGFDAAMAWASSGSHGPMFAMLSPGLPGGGNRTLRETVDKQWPLVIGDREYRDYIYTDQGAQGFAHEIGHMIGHGPELYVNRQGTQCLSASSVGYLAGLSLMGTTTNMFPGMNGVNRWRFGFAEARYVTREDGNVTVHLPKALDPSADTRTVLVVHPDPVGHPGEAFLVEYRAPVTYAGRLYDDLPVSGMYAYHINVKAPTPGAPLISLLNRTAACPTRLRPYRTRLSPSTDTNPGLRFYDGTSAEVELTPAVSGGKLHVTVRWL
jgi:M6 family metalloprotease-like protein